MPHQGPGPGAMDERSLLIVYTESNGSSLINQVAVRHPDGAEYRVLTAPESVFVAPLIAPDGRHIAFSRYEDGTLDLFVMNSDGSGELRLTDTPQMNETVADWAPDGEIILYGEATSGWYQVRADGSDRHQSGIPPDADSPKIARDGTAVVFFAFRDNQMDVFTAALDGSNVTNLTHGVGLNFWPAWSPDGSRIVFASNRAAGARDWPVPGLVVAGWSTGRVRTGRSLRGAGRRDGPAQHHQHTRVE